MMLGRLLVVFALCAGRAAAQEDAMEAQRCVWRCLAQSPGVASAEYGQCVAARCSGEDPAPSATLAPAPAAAPWTGGATGDGLGHYAGQADPATGNVIYLTCDTSGARNLLVAGEVEGPSVILSLDIDGQVFGLWFEASPGGFTARLEPGSPVLALMMQAQVLRLRNSVGTVLGQFALTGAKAAIGAALAACGP